VSEPSGDGGRFVQLDAATGESCLAKRASTDSTLNAHTRIVIRRWEGGMGKGDAG
jgi:hypothetical protein